MEDRILSCNFQHLLSIVEQTLNKSYISWALIPFLSWEHGFKTNDLLRLYPDPGAECLFNIEKTIRFMIS